MLEKATHGHSIMWVPMLYSTVPPTRMVTFTCAYALRVNFLTRAYLF